MTDFESLDVAEQHAVARLARVELFETVPAGRPVGDRGERIGGGLAGQIRLPDTVGGHIDDLRYEVARPISRGVHDHDGEGAPHDASVGGDVALVDTVRTPAPLQAFGQQGHVGVQIVRVGDLLEGEFSQLPLAVSEHGAQGSIGAQEGAVQTDHRHTDRRMRKRQFESPLAEEVDFGAKQIGRLRGGLGGLEPMTDGPWPAEVKTLHRGDADGADGVELALALDTFGDHGRAHLSGELGDGVRQSSPRVVDVDMAGDRLVDLDELRGQLEYMRERGEPGAHVIDGDPDAP